MSNFTQKTKSSKKVKDRTHFNFKNRVGESYITKQGENLEIVEYFSNLNCTVKFEKGNILYGLSYSQIISGSVRNPLYPSTLGLGFEGVGKYTFKTHPKIAETWRAMFRRCYNKSYQDKFPTYKDCSIIEHWHNFQNFAQWFEENYNPEKMEGWQLDKDILVKDNKIYSPETCCFVPQCLNILFVKDKKREDKYTGITYRNNNRFQVIFGGKTIGTYILEEEAIEAYIKAKKYKINEVTEKYKNSLDKKVYNTIINQNN